MEGHQVLHGYELLGADDEKVGEIVDVIGDILIVENGTLRKHRYGVPRTFVEIDPDAAVARTNLSKQLIEESPGVKSDEPVDEGQIADYYGLAAGYEAPPTEGDGVLNPDDPAVSADQLTRRLGMTPPEEERARIREGDEDVYGPPGRQIHPPDPHVTSGPDE